jgi:spermidine synthase
MPVSSPSHDSADTPLERSGGLVLVAAVFLLAICGLAYELIAGTLSSYLLGDSVTQFSLVIGLFLTAMGGGSFLSRFVRGNLLAWLAAFELAVGVVGGVMALLGFAAFTYSNVYIPVLLGNVFVVGVLVGLEIPLLVRILRDVLSLRITLAHVFSADYLGALVASLIFPFLLLPHVGLVQAGFLMGLMNVLVAGIVIWWFRRRMGRARRFLVTASIASAVLLAVGLAGSGRLVGFMENRLYQDEVIYAADTPYQRLVLTRWRDDVRMYLDGHLQFASVDEYRYHETLVHPAMSLADRRERVLVLGGGDGLVARQVLKYDEVERIDLVDIDPVVTELFSTRPLLTRINGGSMLDPRVHVHNVDAMRFLEESDDFYDVILMDLPDPGGAGLGKLYSRSFFRLVGRRTAAGGAVATQATSPFRSREAFWCIVHTMQHAMSERPGGGGLEVHPYHTLVPTFGTWGFAVATAAERVPEDIRIDVRTRYLTREMLPGLFVFPPDMAEVQTPVSRLNDPVVCRLYRQGYHKYLE